MIGVLLLGGTTGLLTASMWAIVWPVVIIAIGLWLLLRRTPVGRGWPDSHGDDVVDATVLFSGRRVVSTSRAFRGGSATGPAIFGGHENNVPAPSDPDAPVLRVAATAIFDGVEVKIGSVDRVPAPA